MKTTVVPAQVTTVEDKIAGNLGISQVLLLVAPVFGGSALFVVMPPFFSYAVYKVVLIVCLAAVCSALAIRVKGKILLWWLLVTARYSLRPQFYVFDKNDTYLRETGERPIADAAEEAAPQQAAPVLLPQLSLSEVMQIETLMARPEANVHFETGKKGGLNVHITEVQ